MMVEFFSAEMVCSVCRYLNCKACGDSEITSDASFKARAAFISPSAAITYGRIEVESTSETKKIKNLIIQIGCLTINSICSLDNFMAPGGWTTQTPIFYLYDPDSKHEKYKRKGRLQK